MGSKAHVRRLALVVVGLLAGCSLGNVEQRPCQDSSDCRDAFGFGWSCGDVGFCEAIEPSNRCDEPYPADLFTRPEEHADVFVFGTLFDHASDRDNLRSIELAFHEANQQGGLDGRSVGLVNCDYQQLVDLDNQTPSEAARQGLAWMLGTVGVAGLIGPASSQLVLDVWEPTEAAQLFVISPSATSDALSTIDGGSLSDEQPGLFWRTAPPDAVQVQAILNDLADRGSADVAIIHQAGAYGDNLATRLAAGLGLPPGRVFQYANESALIGAVADAVQLDPLDEVVFISSTPGEVSAFLNSASQVDGYQALPLFLTDTARATSVLDEAALASALFPNIRGTNPIPDPATANLEDLFYAAYSGRYGDDAARDGYNAFSYDAAWIALYAAAWATTQEPDLSGPSLSRGVRRLSDGATIQLRADRWPEAQAALTAGTSVDVRGASGELDFDPATGELQSPIAIWRVAPDGGGFVDARVCYVTGCQDL